jgi:phosphohistidine swiveling domain-containing protein
VPRDHDRVTTWLPDPSHYPEQMTPLSATVWFEAMGRGLHEATRELRAPFGGFATRTDLGWAYENELPPEWEPDDDRFREAALGLPEHWQAELLPRVRAITAEIERLRPERPPPAQARDLFGRLWELVQEQWRLHFLTVIPAQAAAAIFHEAYVETVGGDDPVASYRLLEGTTNAADTALRSLADLARELDIADVILEHGFPDARSRLLQLASGRRWLHALGAYLLLYGGRARWHELSLPRESELPTLTFEALRLALSLPRARQSAAPADLPAELEELAGRARAAHALKESHSYEIDYPGLQATREALRAFGRRLAAEGAFGDPDDVWMLEREEVRGALVGPLESLQPLADRRRDELERGRAQGPAPFLGDPPPTGGRHAILENFYGRRGTGLSGTAASSGRGEGTARVVRDADDFARIEPGDVLVTTTTTPAWTPLFPSLTALVTETGGILSHAAVVAREYGLPAVVGVTDATRLIPDGSRIRVDGGEGTVALL